MCRIYFSLSGVLTLSVIALLAAQRTDVEVPELSAKGPAAYELLLQTEELGIQGLGIPNRIPAGQFTVRDLRQKKEASRASVLGLVGGQGDAPSGGPSRCGPTRHGGDGPTVRSKKIQALLLAGKFDETEPFVRECLHESPEDIEFLSHLDVVLNGQGKYREADELRDRIRKIWEKKYKHDWIARGSPVGESSWAGMISSSKDYYLVGSEYFIPEVEGDKRHGIKSFYKVIALPKTGNGRQRLFKLNWSKIVEELYALEEYSMGIHMLLGYESMPDIRIVVNDTALYLDGKLGGKAVPPP